MEWEFVRWLEHNAPKNTSLSVPIGDDAAVLKVTPGCQIVAAADAIQDGVHFDSKIHSPRQIGRKAVAVNLSDLAAMAARPIAALVTLALPQGDAAGDVARGVLEGAWTIANAFAAVVCGGDTNCWPHPLSVSVSVLGEVDAGRAWTRQGGVAGDQLVVTGSLGGSILGRHIDFTPRVQEALAWRNEFDVRAATDISDGLSIDAASLANASGCGAELVPDSIPISAAAVQRSHQSGVSPLNHALQDGEDFELLLAMPEIEAARFCRENSGSVVVGRLVEESGLWEVTPSGRRPLPLRGYEHS